MVRGELLSAERAIARLLFRQRQYPNNIALQEPHERHLDLHRGSRLAALFSDPHNRRATILASVPWFLQDLATYGIGIFTPTILAVAFGSPIDHVRSTVDIITDDILAAKGSAAISVLLIVGILCAVLLADRVGRIKLQIAGFLGCAAGLLLAALSTSFAGHAQIALIFAGFMIFDFMTNLGPNAQTYLLAGEVFPTPIRGVGAGFAASFAKLGAVMTAFLSSILLAAIGTRALLGAS